jgi:hypothetical protein
MTKAKETEVLDEAPAPLVNTVTTDKYIYELRGFENVYDINVILHVLNTAKVEGEYAYDNLIATVIAV